MCDADCVGKAAGSWASSSAQFPGSAVDNQDKNWGGETGKSPPTILSLTLSLSAQEELLENVYYVWALCRDQSQYDPISAWKVLEFGIAAAGKMLV